MLSISKDLFFSLVILLLLLHFIIVASNIDGHDLPSGLDILNYLAWTTKRPSLAPAQVEHCITCQPMFHHVIGTGHSTHAGPSVGLHSSFKMRPALIIIWQDRVQMLPNKCPIQVQPMQMRQLTIRGVGYECWLKE